MYRSTEFIPNTVFTNTVCYFFITVAKLLKFPWFFPSRWCRTNFLFGTKASVSQVLQFSWQMKHIYWYLLAYLVWDFGPLKRLYLHKTSSRETHTYIRVYSKVRKHDSTRSRRFLSVLGTGHCNSRYSAVWSASEIIFTLQVLYAFLIPVSLFIAHSIRADVYWKVVCCPCFRFRYLFCL
jgi:hypothetical protein